MRLVVVALSASALAACSSGMSAKQCASADWRSWGYQDGAAGQPYALANTRAAACHQHGVALDHAAYHDGREAGLEEYCTPRRGYELGARGGAYDGVCVRHGEFAFVTEYERGRELFAHTAAVADARRRLDAAHADLAAVNADLSELEGIIAASPTGVVVTRLLGLEDRQRDRRRGADDRRRTGAPRAGNGAARRASPRPEAQGHPRRPCRSRACRGRPRRLSRQRAIRRRRDRRQQCVLWRRLLNLHRRFSSAAELVYPRDFKSGRG